MALPATSGRVYDASSTVWSSFDEASSFIRSGCQLGARNFTDALGLLDNEGVATDHLLNSTVGAV
ncbi:MAG: hypothetical protein WDM84_09015 [Bauldia sp.]